MMMIRKTIGEIKKGMLSPLARRQLLSILIFSSVVTLFGSIFQLYYEFRDDMSYVTSEMDQIKNIYLSGMTKSLWELEDDQIRVQMNNALTLRDINYLEIRVDDKPAYAAGKKSDSKFLSYHDFPMVYVDDDSHIPIGVLHIESDYKGVYNRSFKRIFIIMAAQAVKTFMVSFFILFILYRMVTRHLITMAGYIRAVAVETFDKPFALDRKKRKGAGKDELDEVVATIDNLRRAVNYYTDEQDRVEAELRISERKFRTFAEQAIIGICIVNDGRILFANEGLARIYGYSVEEMMSYKREKIFELFHPDDVQKIFSLYRKNLKGTGKSIELRAITKDGKEKWLQLFSKQAAFDDELTIYCILIDTTERRLYENEMKKFKIMTDMANYGAVIFNPDRLLVYANECFAQMHGYDLDDILLKPLTFFHNQNQLERVRELEEILNAKGQYSAEIVEHVKKDGTVFPVLMNTNEICDKSGKLQFCSSTIMDITEMRRLEEQLKHSHKMEAIGTLAGGVAHDFNNILSIIMGNAEIALGWIPDSNPANDHIREIVTASNRARDVVKQLLNFSRKSEDIKEVNQLSYVAKEAVHLIRSTIPRNIEIIYSESGDIPAVLSNATQIHQIIINLCTNAAHAMGEKGGVLNITLGRVTLDKMNEHEPVNLPQGDYVCLEVSDTGTGIRPELLDKIFVPYFTTKETGKGTGMGLAVVHGIVMNHGGGISVVSEPGRGTTFRIFFPAVDSDSVKEIKQTPSLPKGHERILFVDDEKSLMDIVTTILSRFGYHVDAHENPVDALERFKNTPDTFDMVITDMSMPVMSGDRLVREILDIRPSIPIILCTGFNENISDDMARNMGISLILNKPVNLQELLTSVRQVLDNVSNPPLS